MGSDAQLHSARGMDLQAALLKAGLDPAVWASLQDMSRDQLEALVGARSNVCSLIYSPDEEEEEEEELEEDEEDDELEEVKGDKVKSHAGTPRGA